MLVWRLLEPWPVPKLVKWNLGRIVNEWERDTIRVTPKGVVAEVECEDIALFRNELKTDTRYRAACQLKMAGVCNELFSRQMNAIRSVHNTTFPSNFSFL